MSSKNEQNNVGKKNFVLKKLLNNLYISCEKHYGLQEYTYLLCWSRERGNLSTKLDGYDLSIDDMPSTLNEQLYGYDNPNTNLENKFWTNPIEDEQDYIKQMKLSNFTFYSNGSISQDGTVYGSGKSVYKVLKTKSDKGEKLVIGISIVATKDELQQLADVNYIRASSVGVISNAVDAANYYEQTGEIN
nr:anti sigma factor C-terminal domain-containing protein [Listeria welshimeri]